MITSLKINDGFIGNNLTVQVGPSTSNRSLHNNTRSDPITLGMDEVITHYTQLCTRPSTTFYDN